MSTQVPVLPDTEGSNSDRADSFQITSPPYQINSGLESYRQDDEESGKLLKNDESTPLLPTSGSSAPSGFYIPRRYVIAVMLFLGIFVGYVYRMLLSVSIKFIAVGTWWEKNETIQGLLLASFFMGYILTQILAGEMSRKIGPTIVFATGMGISSAGTLIMAAGKDHLGVLFFSRILAGFGSGVLFPGTHAMFSKWIPAHERSTIITAVWSGVQLAQVCALASTKPLIIAFHKWQYLYIFWGCLGLVWLVCWMALVTDAPTSDRKVLLKISRQEREYLIKEIPSLTSPSLQTPWKKLLTSSATWAIVAGHFSNNWAGYVLLSFLPKFLDSVGFEPGSWGLLPYISMAILSVIAGKAADISATRFGVPIVWIRRIWQGIGSVVPSIFLAAIAATVTSAADGTKAIVFLTFAVAFTGFASSGYGANHIDIGPQYAGPLMGITNTVATIPGIVGTFLTGLILDKTHGQYFIVWIIAIVVYAVGLLIFVTFVKGKRVFD